MSLTKQEKIAHLLRRLGLGASVSEMEFYEPLGVDATIDRLLNYEKVEEGFDVKPTAFANKNKDGRIQLNMPQLVSWWALRMLTTQRPLQEKLTLFWHDHFAVSASKVNQLPMMYQYNETLRKYANGSFRDLLLAMSKDAAMIKWLDNDTNVRGKPNENFAREIMELFTLGIGNYTEKDIQEAARAFTGWNFRLNIPPGRGRQNQRPGPELLAEMMERGEQLFVFSLRPNLHDSGTKTILGNEGNFDGDDVCGILVGKPETAKYISKKLWEWFAYENPDEKIVQRLAKVYFDGGLNIKKMLQAIVESDEFWSDKCVRKLVKNPVDFTIATFRQIGLGPSVLEAVKTANEPRLALAASRGVDQLMERQGMRLLFPPDVAGWDWGTAWISSATMVERIKVADAIFAGRAAQRGPFAAELLSGKPQSTPEDVVESLLKVFDANVAPERKKALVEAVQSNGGADAASNPRQAPALLNAVCRVLFAAPEYQFC